MVSRNLKWLTDFLAESIPIWKKNPASYFKEVLLFEPDSWQEAAASDLAISDKVTIKSGQGVGKTGFEAASLLWFLTCYSDARVVATAPTKQQLNDVLWSEVAKWMNRSSLLSMLLKWTKTYIYVKGYEKRWFAVARTATKPENMQGFHEDNMLFIIDEASGVADSIMEAVLGTLSGENNKLLMCGNPTQTTGAFYDSHTVDRALYCCHTVSALESQRTSKENIKSLIKKYGEESNVVRVRVKGLFPKQEDDVFLSMELIEKSTMIELEEVLGIIMLGVDVARFGDDETVIAQNIGGKVSIPITRKGQDLMQTVGDIVVQYKKIIKRYPQYKKRIYINIDDTGLGGGVTDRLREVKKEQGLHKMVLVPINAAEKIQAEGQKEAAEYYNNITTHMWACIRELMSNQELSLENDSELIAQLSVRKYRMASNGKLELESKKEMKKRGIASPDRADAVALCCYTGKIKQYSMSIPEESVLAKPSYWKG